ncbi:MAG: ATP-grasp domain-containing protein, partial [Deltaproteobacteria bacterium]|nr:ATP-grasp domain-containing protein [Deltaproteobacteria bacterium]
LNFLHDALSRHAFQMLLPMEEETLDLVSRHHTEFSRLTYLPFVTFEKYHMARSKDTILQRAQQLGIPIPKTWYIKNISELDSLKDRLPYPVVIKPRMGSGAVGITYPRNPADLISQYLSIHKRFPYPMIQELIPPEGPGYGASFLLDERGEVKAGFVHKRLREYPLTGGASTLRQSVRRDDIRDMALGLLKALDWFGVAMVEFKLDLRDGVPKLMEINPRFWGSLALAIESGVNFPFLLYRMSRGEDFKPVEDYQTGKKCRWFLPGDLLHFMHNPGRMKMTPSFFDFWDKDTAYDILSWNDPLPVLGRILTPLTFLYDPDMKERLRKRRS